MTLVLFPEIDKWQFSSEYRKITGLLALGHAAAGRIFQILRQRSASRHIVKRECIAKYEALKIGFNLKEAASQIIVSYSRVRVKAVHTLYIVLARMRVTGSRVSDCSAAERVVRFATPFFISLGICVKLRIL